MGVFVVVVLVVVDVNDNVEKAVYLSGKNNPP